MEQQRVDIPGVGIVEFPDSMTPDQVNAAAAKLHAQANPGAKPPERPAGLMDRFAADPNIRQMQGEVDAKNGAMNSNRARSGAMVGGAMAAPFTGGLSLIPAVGAMAGAGMVGATANKALGGEPVTTPDAAKQIGTEGLLNAGAEVVGRGTGRLLTAGANRLYQSALAPTVAMRAEHPNLIRTGIENAVPVTSGGLEKAGGLKNASVGAANQMVADAAAQPNAATIDPRRAVGGITSAVRDVRNLPVARPQMEAIGDYGRQYLTEHPRPLTLTDAQEAVRATDRFYNPSYRATMDRGNPVTSGQTAAAMGINNETRQMLRQAVPGLQEQNANTQALAGLEQALERRTGNLSNAMPFGMRHLINAGVGGAVGGFSGKESGPQRGLMTFLALEGINNPAIGSTGAIALDRAAPQSAQAIRAALLALMKRRTDTPPER